MRFYLKLSVMVALFAALTSPTGQRMTRNLIYEAWVALVYAVGTDADFDRLVEHTRRMLAAERNACDSHVPRQRLVHGAAAGDS